MRKKAVKTVLNSLKSNAIVACCTPNWLPLASFTLLTCVQQGVADISDIFIITIGSTQEEREKVNRFFEKYNTKINIIEGKLPSFLDTIVATGVSPGMVLRLALEEYLPASYERVLYVDSDVFAISPIAPVFAANLNGKALGAVEDWHSMPGPLRLFQDHPRALGLPANARYFNSGVMLMDWKKVIADRLLHKTIELWAAQMKLGVKIVFADQDALNLSFKDNWQPLPVAMNASSVLVDYFPKNIILRHLSAHYKPWGKIWMPGMAKFKAQYRSMAVDSPWPEFVVHEFETIDIKELLGTTLRRQDFITRARYQRHANAGLMS